MLAPEDMKLKEEVARSRAVGRHREAARGLKELISGDYGGKHRPAPPARGERQGRLTKQGHYNTLTNLDRTSIHAGQARRAVPRPKTRAPRCRQPTN